MSWIIGKERLITWSSQDLYYIDANDVPQPDTIKIEVSHDGGDTWDEIVASTPNDGSYLWEVTAPACLDAQIKFSGVNNTDITFTTSDFEIEAEAVTAIEVSPSSAVVEPNGTQQFTGTVKNQDGEIMTGTIVWSVDAGGTIDDSTGLFTAGATETGANTITATIGAVTGTATVTVKRGGLLFFFARSK